MTNAPLAVPRWANRQVLGPRFPEVHEADLVAPNGRRMRMVASSRDAIIDMGAQVDAYIGQLRPAGEGESADTQGLDDAVDQTIGALKKSLRGHDALDVMAMLSQFLTPPDLSMWKESNSTWSDSWAAAEVVALVLLGLGLPTRSPDCAVPTASIIPKLVEDAASVARLASVRGLLRNPNSTYSDDMNALAWRLSSHETSVRGRQYPQVADAINAQVLRTPRTETAFQEVLGFTYDDILAVRKAIIDMASRSIDAAWTQVELVAADDRPATAEAANALRLLFETPSQLGLVTPEQVADEAALDLSIAKAVLDTFSVGPDDHSSEELVRAFCAGRNPMAGKAILQCPSRGYLPLPGALALDEIRRTCEDSVKGSQVWTRYGRARDKVTEGLVVDVIAKILDGQATIHRNLRYRYAEGGHDLSSGSTTSRIAPVTEADALVLLDGVAICVEIKAGGFRARSRQGGVAQLHGDLAKTVQEAAEQADRLRSLIEHNRGLWLENETWLSLDDVSEVHCIVACLDDLGPLALATSELVRAGVLTQTHLPWVVSVHDLLVSQEVLDRPEHFLTYLRRRTNRDVAMRITGSDELDILMWYVSGGFYFDPDPDRLFALHLKAKPPTAKERRSYADQGRTIVGTLTDPLDSYYYYEDGTSSQQAACPRRRPMEPRLQAVFDSMRDNGEPGWWRAAADAEGYSTSAQNRIAASIEATLDASAQDASFHTSAIGGFDDTGRWVYIFAAGPDTPFNREHLRQYLRAKKHQEGADRALGVLLAPDGKPRITLWLTEPCQEDDELDALVREMGLNLPSHAPNAYPLKAKKTQAKRRRRKRRR